jgi:hypothetical protein
MSGPVPLRSDSRSEHRVINPEQYGLDSAPDDAYYNESQIP